MAMIETGDSPISLKIAECEEFLLTCIKSAQKLACTESIFLSKIEQDTAIFLFLGFLPFYGPL